MSEQYMWGVITSYLGFTDSIFVFPGDGKTGYNIEPRKVMKNIIAQSGVTFTFTLHDLRRTFITVAEVLDIPAYALKRLLNHKMTQDVTAGYNVMDAERLRVPMQKITDQLLKLAKVKKADKNNSTVKSQNYLICNDSFINPEKTQK